MADKFDVIVVGARCASSPLATLLEREGLRVAVVERAAFPERHAVDPYLPSARDQLSQAAGRVRGGSGDRGPDIHDG
jgi:flavin-dependent dehydrogenase